MTIERINTNQRMSQIVNAYYDTIGRRYFVGVNVTF